MRVRNRKSHIFEKDNTKTEKLVLVLGIFIFILLFIGVGIGMYFLYLETGSIHGTVFAGSMSSVIILLIIWGLFAGKLTIETPKYKIKTTKKRISTFCTIVGIFIVNIAIIIPFTLLGVYEHRAFLLGIIPIVFPTIYYLRENLLLKLKNSIYFQKIGDSSLALKYLKNTNFINHHNYFRNRDLEREYGRYKIKELFKYILKNIFIIIWVILFLLITPVMLLEYLVGPILLWVIILLANIKEKSNLVTVSNPEKNMFFLRMSPTVFQKIDTKIFFY